MCSSFPYFQGLPGFKGSEGYLGEEGIAVSQGFFFPASFIPKDISTTCNHLCQFRGHGKSQRSFLIPIGLCF